MSGCDMCPRLCGADRTRGERGVCGAGSLASVAYASLHMWEEPCISGERGSGTVFFSGCNLSCVFCQNRDISHRPVGYEMTTKELAKLFLIQQERGAHNINLVTPTHFTRQIACALRLAKKRGLTVPIVWNSSSYELPGELENLRGLVDIFLADFKYVSPALSGTLSRAPDYFERAKAAIAKMVELSPEPVLDEDGMMQKGVIVRLLLLPGQTADMKDAVKYLFETYGNRIYLSLMSQYTPVGDMSAYGELTRRVTEEEYDELIDCAVELGVEQGFTQGPESAEESFIPPFTEGNGVFGLGRLIEN